MLAPARSIPSLALSCFMLLTLTLMLQLLPVRAQKDSYPFPETGKTVSGKFLRYWLDHGGTPQQGLPLSEEMQERNDTDGRVYVIQYFERAVFELHPENQPPYDVLLSLLGAFEYKQRYPKGAPTQQPNASSGSRLFPETGKRLGCQFLDHWERTGGLMQHGYPISDEFMQVSEADGKEYRVQYFQRSIFEYHQEAIFRSENRAQPYQTLLVLPLGTSLFSAKHPAQMPSTMATPTPHEKWTCAPTIRGPSSSSEISDAPVRSSVGKGHLLTGIVKSSLDCAPIAGARIVFWLAGPDGQYDDDHEATVFVDRAGEYSFESNYPAYYGAGGPHVHLYVEANGYKGVETEIFLYCNQTEGKFDIVLVPN